MLTKLTSEQITKNLNNHYIEIDGKQFTVIMDKDKELWFHPKQVALTFGYSGEAAANAIQKIEPRFCTRYDQIVYSGDLDAQFESDTIFVKEAGFYSLAIYAKRFEHDREFRNYVVRDIFPVMRGYGLGRSKK